MVDRTDAAVLVKTGTPLVIAEIKIPELKPGQVLVEVHYSGICHTQVLECRGHRGEDRYVPHLLGHEAGGIVVEVGPGANKVKPGDHVVLSWIKGSGANVPGSVYAWNGRSVNAGGVTTFGRYTVASENRVTAVPRGLSLKQAALLGCAVPTGVGAVFNTARAEPGHSVVVFGAGGVGLCAINAAEIAGCTPVIAVDVRENKLALAKDMGASCVIDASSEDPVRKIEEICPGGVDIAVEATGHPSVMVQALHSVRNQGGVTVVAGNAQHGEVLIIDPCQLNNGKQLRGTWGGDTWPDRDFPKYAKLMNAGRLKVESLLSRSYTLEQVNEAIDDLEAGRVARPLIDFTKG